MSKEATRMYSTCLSSESAGYCGRARGVDLIMVELCEVRADGGAEELKDAFMAKSCCLLDAVAAMLGLLRTLLGVAGAWLELEAGFAFR